MKEECKRRRTPSSLNVLFVSLYWTIRRFGYYLIEIMIDCCFGLHLYPYNAMLLRFPFRLSQWFSRWSLHLFNSYTWTSSRTTLALPLSSYSFIVSHLYLSPTTLVLCSSTMRNPLSIAFPSLGQLWCLWAFFVSARPIPPFPGLAGPFETTMFFSTVSFPMSSLFMIPLRMHLPFRLNHCPSSVPFLCHPISPNPCVAFGNVHLLHLSGVNWSMVFYLRNMSCTVVHCSHPMCFVSSIPNY